MLNLSRYVETQAAFVMASASIYFNGHEIDPATQHEGGSSFTPDASGSNYHFVTCSQQLEPSQERDLQSSGAAILDFHRQQFTYVDMNRQTFVQYEVCLSLQRSMYAHNIVIHPDLRHSIAVPYEGDEGAAGSSRHIVHIILTSKSGQGSRSYPTTASRPSWY